MTLCHNHRKEDPFARIHKSMINDDRISWKATGILAYAFSRPDDWKFYKNEIMSHKKDGECAFDSGIAELEELGYLHRIKSRHQETKEFDGWEWHWFEEPISKEEFKNFFRNGGFPGIGKTSTSAKSGPTNKDILKTNEDLKKDLLNDKRERGARAKKTQEIPELKPLEGRDRRVYDGMLADKDLPWIEASSLYEAIQLYQHESVLKALNELLDGNRTLRNTGKSRKIENPMAVLRSKARAIKLQGKSS